MSLTIDIVADTHDSCGEAPIWDAAGKRVIWTDNESSKVYQWPAAGGAATLLSDGLQVSGIAFNADGRLVFAGAGGVHLWRGPGDYQTLVTEYGGVPLSINDMIADPKGRLYAGTMFWGPDGMVRAGALYLVERAGTIRPVEEGIGLSNGLGFSPDDRTLYYTDSTARRIYAYNLAADGSLSGKRVFAEVSADEGVPDGLTVDADGFVWSATWYGGQIVRYDPQGKLERRIKLPYKQTSSLIFGGPDLDEIFVTTAFNSWRGPYTPPGYDFDKNIGGPLLRVRGTGIRGRLEHVAQL